MAVTLHLTGVTKIWHYFPYFLIGFCETRHKYYGPITVQQIGIRLKSV